MMKLDLNAYDVQVMSCAEMWDTSGGNLVVRVLAWALGSFAWESVSNPKDVAKAVNEGAAKAAEIVI